MASKRLSASDFNCSIRIEQPTESPDGVGGTVRGWTTYATMWAKVRVSSALEIARIGAQLSNVTRTFVVRNLSAAKGITTAMRVIYESEAYNIASSTSDTPRDQVMNIVATKGVANG